MKKRCILPALFPAAGAFCLALFVFAFLAGCDDILHNPSTTPDLDVLYPPPNPGPSPTAGDAYMQVQFTKVEGALSYRVYYSTDPDNPGWMFVEVPQGESQLVEAFIYNLTNGVTYYVWAEARFEDARSKLAGPAAATPRAKPGGPPVSLAVSANDSSLDLAWPLVYNADSYIVYWSETGGGATPPEGAPHAEFTVDKDYAVMGLISSLTNGTNYNVWIRASNTSGESVAYTHSTGQPAQGGSPGKPAGAISLAPSDKTLTVRWDAAKQATGYNLYYGTASAVESGHVTVNAGSGRMNSSIGGLTNGQPYYVWVTAVNGITEGAVSADNSETPQPKPALDTSKPTMPIGETTARFPNEEAGKGDRLSRKQETALGDLTADSMYYYAVKYHKGEGKNQYSQIDFAFVNGGVITAGLPKGLITVGTVHNRFYADAMSIIQMTGANVKVLFHDYVAKVSHSGGGGKGTGAFGQVSEHVRYTIDYNHDPRGGVISGLTFNGKPFDDNTLYTFVTSTYLLDDNTDGYCPILLKYIENSRYDTGKVISWAVIEWIYDQDAPIEPKTDGRIVLQNEVW